MLSFALAEMYRAAVLRRAKAEPDRALTEADFNTIEGVAGSLHHRADKLWEDAEKNPVKQKMIRWLFLRMVSEEGGRLSRRRVSLEELERRADTENEALKEALKDYEDAYLIICDDGFVEPTHDTLVVAWPLLLSWHGRFGSLRLVRDVWAASQAWQESKLYGSRKTQNAFLWTMNHRLPQLTDLRSQTVIQIRQIFHRLRRSFVAKKLKLAKAIRLELPELILPLPEPNLASSRDQLNRRELEFIDASSAQYNKRRRRLHNLVRFMILILTTAGPFFLNQANHYKNISKIATTRLQYTTVNELLDHRNPELASLVALEIEDPEPEDAAQLLRRLVDSDHMPDRDPFGSLDVQSLEPLLLQALIRSYHPRCLSSKQRQKHLYEPPDEATARAQACEQCLPIYFEVLDPQPHERLGKLVPAWQRYLACQKSPPQDSRRFWSPKRWSQIWNEQCLPLTL